MRGSIIFAGIFVFLMLLLLSARDCSNSHTSKELLTGRLEQCQNDLSTILDRCTKGVRDE